MGKLMSDLISAAGESSPALLSDLKSSGLVPDDFEIGGVSGLTDNTGGEPYDAGDSFLIEVTFSGQKAGHDGNLANVKANYSTNESSNITVKNNDIVPSIEWEVDSKAPDGTETIGITYDEPFNSGATDVGVEQTIDITITGYSITVTATPISSTEVDVDYEIVNGIPDYDIVVYRKSGGSYSAVHTDTHTSEGTYTYSDTGLTSGTAYTYKVTCRDEGGTGASVSDTDSATPISSS